MRPHANNRTRNRRFGANRRRRLQHWSSRLRPRLHLPVGSRRARRIAGSTGFGTNGFRDIGFLGEEPGEDNFTAIFQSVALGLEISERNTLYVEWFGVFSSGREEEYSISVFNMGVDHYITNNFVVDFRAGVGLTEDSDDFFTGVGGGYRF